MMEAHYSVILFLVVILIVLGLMVFVVMEFLSAVSHAMMETAMKMMHVVLTVP